MSAWGPARAILLAILRERFNLGFRFSKVKKGVWKFPFQVLLVIFFSGMTREMFQHAGLSERVVVMLLDALGFSLFRVFMVAPKQMFQPSQHTLPLLTPAPPISVLIGQVLADMPLHLWSMLMFAWVMSSGMTLGAQMLFIAAMGIACMVIVTLSMFAGHLILVIWSKWVPGGLTVFFVLAILVQVSVAFLVFYLILKVDVIDPAVWTSVSSYGETAVIALAAFFGTLLLWFAARPAMFDRWYLDAWTVVNEGGKGKRVKAQRSTWPYGLSGVSGSLWAKDLILIRKNPIYKVRMLVWALASAAIAVLLYSGLLPEFVAGVSWLEDKSAVWLCVLLAVAPGHLLVAEMITTLHELDRNKRYWFVISCMSPWRIMRSKVCSGTLFYLLPCVLLAVGYGVLLALPFPHLLLAALFAGLLSFAMIGFLLGIAAFDVKLEEIGRAVKTDAVREQVPQTIATIGASFGSLFVLAGAYLWIDGSSLIDLAKMAVFVIPALLSLLFGTIWIGKRLLLT